MMRWNRKNCNLDERQLQIRGDIFKRSWIFTLFLLAFNTIYQEITGHGIFVVPWNSLFILAILVSITAMEMIHYDIYPLSKKINARYYLFIGSIGIIFIIGSIYYLLIEQEPILINGMINVSLAMFCVGVCYNAIGITYIWHAKFHKEEE